MSYTCPKDVREIEDQIRRFLLAEAKDVRDMNSVPSFEDDGRPNMALFERFENLKKLNGEIRDGFKDDSIPRDLHHDEMARLAQAWEEFNWEKQPATSEVVENQKARLRDMVREDVKAGIIDKFRNPLKGAMPPQRKWQINLLDETRDNYVHKLTRHEKAMALIVADDGEITSLDKTENAGFNGYLAADLSREEQDLDFDMMFDGLEALSWRDNYGYDRKDALRFVFEHQLIVERYWYHFRQDRGTAGLCQFKYRCWGIPEIRQAAEDVIALRYSSPRLDSKHIRTWFNVQQVRIDLAGGGDITWDREGQLLLNYKGEAFDLEREYDWLQDVTLRWFYRDDLMKHGLAKKPRGNFPVQILGTRKRTGYTPLKAKLPVRQDFCWKCAERADDSESYFNHLAAKKATTKVFYSRKKERHYAITPHLRDTVNLSETQEKFCGRWFEFADVLYGSSGEWKCLMCGTRTAYHTVTMEISRRTRKGHKMTFTVDVSGQNFINYLIKEGFIKP